MWQARLLCICLICDFCSLDREFALGLLHTPPPDGRTCPHLTVPTAKPEVEFHHLVTAHCGQTKKNARWRLISLTGIFLSYFRPKLEFLSRWVIENKLTKENTHNYKKPKENYSYNASCIMQLYTNRRKDRTLSRCNLVTVTDSTLNLLKAAVVSAKTAESLYLLRLKLASDDAALMPVQQRGGIFIVMTTRKAQQ